MTNYELYHVEPVNEKSQSDWMSLVVQSPQSTPFLRSDILAASGFLAERYLVYRRGDIYMGICIPIEKASGEAKDVPFAPYQGLLYMHSCDNYTDYHNNLEATDVLLEYLYENGKQRRIRFSNSCTVRDLRSVQWHHYHEPEKGVYNIEINYTAIFPEKSEFVNSVSKGRKLDYKYSKERYGISTFCSECITDFMNLYEKTFMCQGIYLTHKVLEQVETIIRTGFKSGIGKLWYAKDENGSSIDAIYVLSEYGKSYYLFGANAPDFKKKGGGTLLLMEQLMSMKDNGIKTFDFVGVNSPHRGDFKLSFGGKIEPYYICTVDYRGKL